MTNKLLILGGLVGGLALAVGCGDSGSSTSGSGGDGTGATGSGGSTTTTTTTSTGGGGTGGSTTTGGAATCASYCTSIMANCSGADQQYLTQATCEAECASFAQGAAGAMSGNNLECRAYHAGVAGTAMPEVNPSAWATLVRLKYEPSKFFSTIGRLGRGRRRVHDDEHRALRCVLRRRGRGLRDHALRFG